MVFSYVRFLKISIVVINGPRSRIVGSLHRLSRNSIYSMTDDRPKTGMFKNLYIASARIVHIE